MRKSVLRSFALTILAAILICSAVSAALFDRMLTRSKEDDLTALALVFAGRFDPEEDNDRQAQEFAAADIGIRVTVVAPDGMVTGDSEADYREMGSHAGREEIIAAREEGTAVVIRSSSTLGRKLMYAVTVTEDGYYLRLSQEYNGITANLVILLPAVLAAGVAAGGISYLLAVRLSRSVTEPISAMNASLPGVKDGSTTLDPEAYPYEELRSMAEQINALADDVSSHIGRLHAEERKINYMLDNLNEGLLLLDTEGRILLINRSACAFLGCQGDMHGQLLRDVVKNSDLTQAAANVLARHNGGTTDLPMGKLILEARFKVIGSLPDMAGMVLLTLTDVTESRQSARMRQEFFSNASHELKTPITAIKGNAELLCSGLPLSDAQQKELLARIGMESDRMSGLIQDIIMISCIESGGVPDEAERVDFAAVVRSCVEENRALAKRNDLKVSLCLQPASLVAVRKNLYELAGNLIVNAMKYNEPGGAVDISLERQRHKLIFSVRNDGEPIPAEQQKRVFERFYRVDSGRSRSVGGTGLGLAIVKHIVDSMEGSIRLTSTAGEGTRFTVELPAVSM